MSRTLTQRALTVFGGLALAGTLGMAQAAPVSFSVPLTGAQEVQAVQTSGTGNAAMTYDAATRVVTWNITFSGLSSTATMAHFHGPAAAGKNAGVKVAISQKDAKELASPLIGQATLSADDAKILEAGEMYVNVHSKNHPGGELRGQVMVPKAN